MNDITVSTMPRPTAEQRSSALDRRARPRPRLTMNLATIEATPTARLTEAKAATTGATAAPARLVQALAEAQAQDLVVRKLAALLDLHPTTVQRLLATTNENA